MELRFTEQEERTEAVKTAKKRKTAAKRVETLEEAFQRLADLKWDADEWTEIQSVRSALTDGTLKRADDSKKLSKKELLELSDRLREIRRQERIQRLVDSAPQNYRVITDIKQFRTFMDQLYDEPLTSWDTETTGLDLFEDRMVGYSVWLPQANVGYYVPFAHGDTVGDNLPAYGTVPSYKRFDGQLDPDLALENIREYLEDGSRKTIWHNARFDFHMFMNHGIRCADPFFDTLVAAHELNENETHHLKDLGPRYLHVEADHFGELWGDSPTVYEKGILPVGVYAIKDTELTYKLYEFQVKHINARDGLRFDFWNIQMPQVRLSFEMERCGFGLDISSCAALESELQKEVDADLASLDSQLGVDSEMLKRMSDALRREITSLNVSSPQQLQWLLYDEMGLPDIAKSVNPKLQSRSTAAAVLEKLVEIDERIKPLVDFREKEKLLNTYVRKFKDMVGPDGRIHYQLNPWGTETGRYSSSQYGNKNKKRGVNIQNQPARSKTAKRVRMLMIP